MNAKDKRNRPLQELMEKIGYRFNDANLLNTALTHASASQAFNNERLEFLGDAVLELCVSDYLFRSYAHLNEGEMTRARASAVCEDALFQSAKQIALGDFLRLGAGEERMHGREKPSIVSDAMEALIGALYLDGGFDCAMRFVRHFVPNAVLQAMRGKGVDSKTRLQEFLQQKGSVDIVYEITHTQGPDHDKRFFAQVSWKGRVWGRGEGRNKKEAEQCAAQDALEKLDTVR